MKLIEGINISLNKDHEIWTNLLGGWKRVTDAKAKEALRNCYHTWRSKKNSEAKKTQVLAETLKVIEEVCSGITISPSIQTEVETKAISDQQKMTVKVGIKKLIDFFKEFDFEPNFRFLNTIARTIKISKSATKAYVSNYFELADNQHAASIGEKIKSSEFDGILTDLQTIACEKQINKRFKLYYGSQGTGKTTIGMKESDGRVMVCHSAMLPSDLMEDFKFNDGKAAFTPSALCEAMTKGQIIVLDEINLLPFESLRFLQSLLDGKAQFTYKGIDVSIKDGFQVIGTMNLTINGCNFGLPEPLVDRCSEIKKFKLSENDLLGAII